MEKRFKEGDELYLMVKVHGTKPSDGYDYIIWWKDAVDGMDCLASVGQAQLVSGADFGTSNGIDWQATYNEYSEKAQRTIAGLSKRITEMDALLKDTQSKVSQLESALSAQNDANLELEDKNALLSRKNRELEESLPTKKGEVKHWRGMYMHMKTRCDEYKRAADNLKAERDRADDELALTKIMNVALAEKIERLQNG